ncbi:MAG: ABC transporter permease [Enterovibrio sp.]
MLLYFLRRVFWLSMTLLFLSVITFTILRIDAQHTYSHVPFIRGWWNYLFALSQGDLGVSVDGVPIIQALLSVFPATLELCLFAFIIALIIGVPLGTIAGLTRGRLIEKAISSITLVISSVPIFWLAILLISLLSFYYNSLPLSSRYNLLYDLNPITGFAFIDAMLIDEPWRSSALLDIASHLILPSIVLASAPTSELIKLLRDAVADVVTQNYVKAAATRGLSTWQIVRKHVIKNALPPTFSKFSVQISAMMTSAIITEYIFNWPGIGSWLLNALYLKDHVAIQGGVLAVGCMVLLMSLLFELASAMMSPLIRKEWYAVQR